MRTISKEELEKILENHRYWYKRWLKGDANEVDGMYANLGGVDLRGVDLCGANLRGANLSDADLRGADLRGANLGGANLFEADLGEANLNMANLYGANLIEADLIGANLTESNLLNAALPDPEIINSICPLTCPETGAFIGWKKADIILSDECGWLGRAQTIIELQIPEHAKRSSATGRKCRCNKARVLDIWSLEGVKLQKGTIAYSRFDPTFTYEVGQKLYVANFDDDRWNECSTGIHFFITRQEAVDY